MRGEGMGPGLLGRRAHLEVLRRWSCYVWSYWSLSVAALPRNVATFLLLANYCVAMYMKSGNACRSS